MRNNNSHNIKVETKNKEKLQKRNYTHGIKSQAIARNFNCSKSVWVTERKKNPLQTWFDLQCDTENCKVLHLFNYAEKTHGVVFDFASSVAFSTEVLCITDSVHLYDKTVLKWMHLALCCFLFHIVKRMNFVSQTKWNL